MLNKYFSEIKNINIFGFRLGDKEFLKKGLIILGFGSLMSAGGFLGYAVNGLIGGVFGLLLGFVAGKLVKI